MVLQLAASGLSDNCCAGVSSCQADLKDVLTGFEGLTDAAGLDNLTDDDAARGAEAAPCAITRGAAALTTSKKENMAL